MVDERDERERTPRWVKLFGAVALVIVVLFVVLLLVRGPGDHGPGRHGTSGGNPPAAGT